MQEEERPRVGKDEVKSLLLTVYVRVDEPRENGKPSQVKDVCFGFITPSTRIGSRESCEIFIIGRTHIQNPTTELQDHYGCIMHPRMFQCFTIRPKLENLGCNDCLVFRCLNWKLFRDWVRHARRIEVHSFRWNGGSSRYYKAEAPPAEVQPPLPLQSRLAGRNTI